MHPIYFEINDDKKITAYNVDTIEELDASLAEARKTSPYAYVQNVVITPVVGMGVTQHVGSDSYPFTIVKVINPKRIVVQRDKATRVDSNGYGGKQEYVYERQPDSEEITVTLRINGRWIVVGESLKSCGFSLGRRSAYQDPSF